MSVYWVCIMSEIQRINITLPRKLVKKSRILIKEGLYSNFSELIREGIKKEMLADQSLLDKKRILDKWFREELGKGGGTSNLSEEALIKKIRVTRDELWKEKCNEWFEAIKK